MKIRRILHSKIANSFRSIRSRILLASVFFMLIFGILASSVTYVYTSDNARRSLISTSENRLIYLCSSIESSVRNVSGFVHACQNNKQVIAFTSDTAENSARSRLNAHDSISDLYRSNSALSRQMVRMVLIRKSHMDFIQIMPADNSSVLVTGENVVALPYFGLLHRFSATAAAGIHPDPFLPRQNLAMIPMVYVVQHPYNADETGYIFVELSASILTAPIAENPSAYPSSLRFELDDISYIYQEETGAFEEDFSHAEDTVLKDLSSLSLTSGTDVSMVRKLSDGKQYLRIMRPISAMDWNLCEYIEYSQILAHTRKAFLMIFLAILVSITLFGVLLFLFLYHNIETPVNRLLDRMDRIKNGDFSRDPSTEWDHELGQIGKTINDLSENVLLLMDQRIADEKEKKDYEYRMLQSQINPHFLYNTLNSIKWMATLQHAPGIAEMTTSLSRLLKDISKGVSNVVSIEHEFDLIRDYFVIQQYRYGGTITIDVDIDDNSLLDCQILKFTLQPIVENSIFHGIEPKGTTGKIRIHLYAENDNSVRIDVTDDGVGIAPEKAAILLNENNEKNHSSFFREIGINNVHKRLKYEFGPSYGLSIESEVGAYTTISVLLPRLAATEQE